jgi:hypothetical protein
MLNGAKLPTVKRKGLWTEVARTATDLENILVSARKPIASYNAFLRKSSPACATCGPLGRWPSSTTTPNVKCAANLTIRADHAFYLVVPRTTIETSTDS